MWQLFKCHACGKRLPATEACRPTALRPQVFGLLDVSGILSGMLLLNRGPSTFAVPSLLYPSDFMCTGMDTLVGFRRFLLEHLGPLDKADKQEVLAQLWPRMWSASFEQESMVAWGI